MKSQQIKWYWWLLIYLAITIVTFSLTLNLNF
jgi:hypothetical protein